MSNGNKHKFKSKNSGNSARNIAVLPLKSNKNSLQRSATTKDSIYIKQGPPMPTVSVIPLKKIKLITTPRRGNSKERGSSTARLPASLNRNRT